MPIIVACLISVLGAYAVLAQAPTPGPTGSISGRVVDAANGAPVRRARVVLSVASGRIASITTNEDGRFLFEEAAETAHTVRASKAGYTSATVAAPSQASETPLELALTRSAGIEGRVRNVYGGLVSGAYGASESCRQAAPAARPPGRSGTGVIQGRVTGPLGEPLACARVFLVGPPAPVPQVSTDPEGWFSIEGLAEGAFVVGARKPGYERLLYGQRQWGDDEVPIALRAGEQRTGVDFVLRPNPAISGAVVDEHGEPVQGIRVEAWQLYRSEGREGLVSPVDGRPIFTDDRGRFRLSKPPGSYLVVAEGADGVSAAEGEPPRVYTKTYYPGTPDASAAQRVVAVSGRDAHGIDILLVPSFAATVSGVALNSAGRPFSGTISLSTSARSGALVAVSRTVSPDGIGRFVIRDVPHGDYVVKASQSANGGRQFGMQYVTVVDDSPPAVNIRTAEGATVHGRVVLDGVTAADDLGIRVSAYPTDPDQTPVSIPAGDGVGLPASNLEGGTFHLAGVTGPSRLLVTTPRCESCYLVGAYVSGVDAADRPFDAGLTGGTYRDAEIVVSSAGGTIEGRVLDERKGVAISHVVVLFPTDRDLWHPRSRHVRSTLTRSGEPFLFAGLPPGEYFVGAFESPGPEDAEGHEPDNPALLERLRISAERVTIAERERRTLSLRTIPTTTPSR